MRVIFLDFDGVLNSAEWMNSRDDRGGCDLDRAAVARVQAICDRAGAVIVISSSWRCLYEMPVLRDILRAHGLTAEVIGRTPQIKGRTSPLRCLPEAERVQRGEEIAAWLREHTVASFVILDDDSDMAHLRDRLVQTGFERGLQAEHVEHAVALLQDNTSGKCS